MQEIIVGIIGVIVVLVVIRNMYNFFFSKKRKVTHCGCSDCRCDARYKAKKMHKEF